MDREISANREQSDNSLKASLVKLNEAYSNNQLDGYRALDLKDSHVERTTCDIQWGPMMRT